MKKLFLALLFSVTLALSAFPQDKATVASDTPTFVADRVGVITDEDGKKYSMADVHTYVGDKKFPFTISCFMSNPDCALLSAGEEYPFRLMKDKDPDAYKQNEFTGPSIRVTGTVADRPGETYSFVFFVLPPENSKDKDKDKEEEKPKKPLRQI